jgi:hypothetical protein
MNFHNNAKVHPLISETLHNCGKELHHSHIIQPANVSIVNIEGQPLIIRQLTQPKTQIDISNLPQGVYVVKLTSTKSVATTKLIKQ